MVGSSSNRFLRPAETVKLVEKICQALNAIIPDYYTPTWRFQIKQVIASILLDHTEVPCTSSVMRFCRVVKRLFV